MITKMLYNNYICNIIAVELSVVCKIKYLTQLAKN